MSIESSVFSFTMYQGCGWAAYDALRCRIGKIREIFFLFKKQFCPKFLNGVHLKICAKVMAKRHLEPESSNGYQGTGKHKYFDQN